METITISKEEYDLMIELLSNMERVLNENTNLKSKVEDALIEIELLKDSMKEHKVESDFNLSGLANMLGIKKTHEVDVSDSINISGLPQ